MKRNHRTLKAWQEAIELVDAIYLATATFPADERFGLTSQLRRAAVSVPANIAEGFARTGTRELLHFLSIASGSLSELDTLIEIAGRQQLIANTEALVERIDRVSALVLALASALKKKMD
jgi:four helix bundle protein